MPVRPRPARKRKQHRNETWADVLQDFVGQNFFKRLLMTLLLSIVVLKAGYTLESPREVFKY